MHFHCSCSVVFLISLVTLRVVISQLSVSVLPFSCFLCGYLCFAAGIRSPATLRSITAAYSTSSAQCSAQPILTHRTCLWPVSTATWPVSCNAVTASYSTWHCTVYIVDWTLHIVFSMQQLLITVTNVSGSSGPQVPSFFCAHKHTQGGPKAGLFLTMNNCSIFGEQDCCNEWPTHTVHGNATPCVLTLCATLQLYAKYSSLAYWRGMTRSKAGKKTRRSDLIAERNRTCCVTWCHAQCECHQLLSASFTSHSCLPVLSHTGVDHPGKLVTE